MSNRVRERRLRARLDAVGGRALPRRDDLGELGADEVRAPTPASAAYPAESRRRRAAVDGPAQLLVVVVRAGAAGRKPSPSRIPASCGPNESVTPASNQQIIPALEPARTMPCSQASRRRASKPCTRQIASMFAVFPPPTTIASWASTSSRRFSGGQGKNSSRRTSARPWRGRRRGERRPGPPPSPCRPRARAGAAHEPEHVVEQAAPGPPPPIATICRSAIGRS